MNDGTMATYYAIVNADDPAPRPWARFHTRSEAESYLRGFKRRSDGCFELNGYRYRVVRYPGENQ